MSDADRLAEGLEDLRSRLPGFAGAADLSALRGTLEGLQARAESGGDDATADALRRLALLVDVWECVGIDGPAGMGEDLRAFLAESVGRLADDRRAGTVGSAASWVMEESVGRWGEYLGLIDPSFDPETSTPAEDAGPVEPPPDDPGPAIDPTALLKLLAGAAPTPADSAGPTPVPPVVGPGPDRES